MMVARSLMGLCESPRICLVGLAGGSLGGAHRQGPLQLLMTTMRVRHRNSLLRLVELRDVAAPTSTDSKDPSITSEAPPR